MTGIIFYSVFLAMGVLYADRFFSEKSLWFKLWSGGVIGNVILMFGIVPLGFLFGFTKLAHIILAGIAVSPYLMNKRKLSLYISRPYYPAAITTAGISLLIFALFQSHILAPVSGGFATGQSTYGDTAMHLGFISSIAEKGVFPPEFNLLSGNRLCYPFLVDSLSSSLYLFGSDLRTSIIVPSFVISALTVCGFYFFSKELVGKRAAALSLVLFFLGGGFGFCYFMNGGIENFMSIFTEYYKTPTNFVEENIRWVNPICDMIIPQRTTMAGWCVLYFALWLLIQGIKGRSTKIFILLGLVGGSMPMIHTHSYLALVIISLGCLVAFYKDAEDKRRYIKNWVIYAVIAFLLSIGQLVFWTFSQSVGNSQFLRFGYNWANNGDTSVWFWIKNWGITALLMIPAWLSQSKFNKKFSVGFCVIFLIAEFVIFQPNEYDNNKLFFVTYMLFVTFVSGYIVEIFDKLKGVKAGGILAVFVVFFGIFSGTLSIIREWVSGYDYLFFTHQDMEFAEFVKENTNKDGLFITGNDHINPVAVVAGRSIYAGSELYVYFHGYGDEMYKRYDEIKAVYQSKSKEEILENLEKIDGDYIVISPREREKYEISEELFSGFECIYNKDGIKLFQISGQNI